jgi:hypothetical protein
MLLLPLAEKMWYMNPSSGAYLLLVKNQGIPENEYSGVRMHTLYQGRTLQLLFLLH